LTNSGQIVITADCEDDKEPNKYIWSRMSAVEILEVANIKEDNDSD